MRQVLYDAASTRWICERDLLDDRVRNHPHIVGRYNRLAMDNKVSIPFVFHNLRKHGVHVLMQQMEWIAKFYELCKGSKEKNVIQHNVERFHHYLG